MTQEKDPLAWLGTGPHWRDQPLYWRRRVVWWPIAALGIVILSALMAAVLRRRSGVDLREILLYGPLLVMGLVSLGIRRVKRQILLRVDAADGRLCAACGYDVSTLDSEGRCPECGTEYTFDRLRAAWKLVKRP